jgi:hypothetical protein
MDFVQAKELILMQGYRHPNHSNAETGFLGSLLPYRALRGEKFELQEKNLYEILEAVDVVAIQFQNEATVDKEIVGTLWSICHLVHNYIRPDSAWRRTNLMTSKDATRLEKWIEILSYTVLSYLSNGQPNWREMLSTGLEDE